jgi:hypothetical protein
MLRAEAAPSGPSRGISFGGALDGDRRGDDGWLQERHYDAVREAGFDTVRLPVKWSAHLEASPREPAAALPSCSTSRATR